MLDTDGGTWVQLAKGAEPHVETLPGVNPEYFNVISHTMAQYLVFISRMETSRLPSNYQKIAMTFMDSEK